MNEEQATTRNARVWLALALLFAIGVVLVLWGLVGPYATGPAQADAIVGRLGLKADPETYTDLAMMLAESQLRRGYLCAATGVLIALVAGCGLYNSRHRP